MLKIFYIVGKMLEPEDIAWLKQNIPAVWNDFAHLEGLDGSIARSAWEIDNLYNVYAISLRIQEIVDAKIQGKLTEVATFGEGLPKIYLQEIASRFLNLDITDKTKWQLINDILATQNTSSS